MDAIAEAVEVSKGTLYLYFKSRERLVAEVTARIFEAELDQLATQIDRAGDFETLIGMAMKQIARGLDGAAERLGPSILLADAALDHIAACCVPLRDRLFQTGLTGADAARVVTMTASWALGLVVSYRGGFPGIRAFPLEELAQGSAQLLIDGWRRSTSHAEVP